MNQRFFKKYFKWCVIYIVTINNGFAYNGERCEKYLDRHSFFNGNAELISSTQLTSSFGECSLMGDREKEIELYFYVNYNSIKTDASRGKGEYLDGLMSLLSCNEEAGKRLSKYMQGDFEKIFIAEEEKIKDAKELYSNFRKKMLIDRREFMSCIF